MSDFQISCFGEVLWDVFPTHKVIGGAPLNVALRLQSFGVKVAMISRIGEDEDGHKAIEYLENHQLIINHVQLDKNLATGNVQVSLDEHGSASYVISKPVAWDNIQVNDENLELVHETEVFVYGSLAVREPASRKTLSSLLDKANYKVFDVNLRPPDYSIELIVELMYKANFVKLNDEELDEICLALNGDFKTLEKKIQFLSDKTNTDTICVTLGSKGALLFRENIFFRNSGYQVKVEDTVGAGDSFLASLIYKMIIEKKEPQESLDFACAVGSLVASKKGANARISSREIDQMMKK